MMRLYVGNLPWSVQADALAKQFATYGAVAQASIVVDEDGRSRGFGFVTMPDRSGAEDAVKVAENMGMTMDGRRIRVNEAKQREDKRPRQDNR